MNCHFKSDMFARRMCLWLAGNFINLKSFARRMCLWLADNSKSKWERVTERKFGCSFLFKEHYGNERHKQKDNTSFKKI